MADVSEISLIVFDVDGVLTDGGLYINDQGTETKRFHVRDGTAIRLAQRVGLNIAVMTGRTSRTVTTRLNELDITLALQGVADKAEGLHILCNQADVAVEHCAVVGDDLLDLPAMTRCGYPIAVGDALKPVKDIARYITHANGGHGAAREAIQHILDCQDKWDTLVDDLLTQ